MKTLLAFAVLLGSLLCASAQLKTATNSVILYPNTTTNVNTSIDARRQQNIPIQIQIQSVGTNTDTCRFTFCGSMDNTNRSGSPQWLLTMTANGTTAVYLATNLNISGWPYLTLTSITNGAGTALTNVSVKYWIKASAP